MAGEAAVARLVSKMGSKTLLKQLLRVGGSIGASTIIGGPIGGILDAVLMADALKDIYKMATASGKVLNPEVGAGELLAMQAAKGAPRGLVGRGLGMASAHPIITALLAGQLGSMLTGRDEPSVEDQAAVEARMAAETGAGSTLDQKELALQLRNMLLMQQLQRGAGQGMAMPMRSAEQFYIPG